MRQTKENVVKLLKEMRKNAHAVAEMLRDDNPVVSSRFVSYASAYDEAIWLLTDSNYFNKVADIYADRIEEAK